MKKIIIAVLMIVGLAVWYRSIAQNQPILTDNDKSLLRASQNGVLDDVRTGVINANVNAVQNYRTPLIFASKAGYYDIASFLLSQPGIDVNFKSPNGNTAFMSAAREGHIGVINAFLNSPMNVRNQININEANKEGKTALMLAVEASRPEVVALLLQQFPNIDFNAIDLEEGKSVLSYAVEQPDLEIFRTILSVAGDRLEAGSINEALLKGVDRGKIEVIRLMKDNQLFWKKLNSATLSSARTRAQKKPEILSLLA